jgi:hypothetical protein
MDWYGAARALLDAYAADIAGISQHIASGGCADHAEYRERCGEIRGIERAMRAIKDRLSDEEKQALGIPTGAAKSPNRKG